MIMLVTQAVIVHEYLVFNVVVRIMMAFVGVLVVVLIMSWWRSFVVILSVVVEVEVSTVVEGLK